MIEILIDGKRGDLEKLPVIPIGFAIEKLTDVEGERSGRVVELELPATPRNNAIFGASADIYASQRFNSEHHTAVVKHDGAVLFEGTVYLLKTKMEKGECCGYSIRISEGGAEWVEDVVYGKLNDLDIPFSGRLDFFTIASSWEEDEAVRFLPIRRGNRRSGYSSTTMPVEWVMLTDDYHPFISIAEMVRAMFAKSGYRMRSDFFDSEFGRSLFMSGDYGRTDVSEAKRMCDFFARRSSPTTAAADAIGRIYASNSVANHSVGPLVDTADPTAVDSNGVQMVETFNTNNAFSKSEAGNIRFTPSRSVNVGFVLHLEYTTDFKIISREELKGFNVVEGENNLRVLFPLVNTFRDLRNQLDENWQYRAIVFDHVEGREYCLQASYGDGMRSILAEWSGRSALVMTTDKPESLQLYYRTDSTRSWLPCGSDWALYAGYVEETGRVDVVMDLRLPPQDVAAGEYLRLDRIYFSGGDPGMSLTLGVGTTLRPYFTTVPGFGSQLEFKDVAPRHIRQVDLLAELGDMFNLAFFTDRARREVRIEPLEQIYDDEVVDINSRIDYRGGLLLSDAGLDTPQTHRFIYKESDEASRKFNDEDGTTLGRWSFRNSLYGTKDSVCEKGGNIFTTTINTECVVSFAPSASLMQVGDTGSTDEGMDEPFTPHIVCYKGLRLLPSDESWVVHTKYNKYPYAAFVDAKGVNLAFEERNGVEGLSRFHKERLRRLEESHRVTLDLYLTAAEMASLLTESGPKPSVRKLFRFDIGGESSLYRIVEVGSWSSETGIVRCTFERVLKD